MTPHLDWTRLLEQRRALAGEPDEASIARHMARWRERLADQDALPEEVLDDELVKLLEAIHHAF